MLFKNIRYYHFEHELNLSSDKMHELLAQHESRSCGMLELHSVGWDKPLGLTGKMLLHETDGCIMLCLRHEEKVLPAAVIREKLMTKVLEIGREKGSTVSRKEKAEIKDQLILELLPKVLARPSSTYAYIDKKSGLLIVNTSSSKRSEELVMFLRKTLGTLPVILPQTNILPGSAMTQWVLNDSSIPEYLSVEDECEFGASEEVSIKASFKGIDLSTQEIRDFAMKGKKVKKLALNWRDRISFVLHDDLSLHRIKYDISAIEDLSDPYSDEVDKFDADFAIMAKEIRDLIKDIQQALS